MFASVKNTLRQIVARRPGEVIFIALAAGFLLAAQLFDFYKDLSYYAVGILDHWRLLAGLMLVLGFYAGVRLGGYALRLANQAWLVVLPWPERARRDAAWEAALLVGCVPAALLGGLTLMMADAVGAAPGAWGAGSFACFYLAFAFAARLVTARGGFGETARDAPEGGSPGVSRLLWWFDRAGPRWLGIWGIGRRSGGLALFWMASLVVFGGGAGVIALVQGWTWPALVASVVGGHLVFLASLDMRPLQSAALRCQPIAYGGAVAGLVRLPLTASLAWFGVAGVPAVVLPAGLSRLPAAALVLVVLNLYFTACLCVVPLSRRQGLVLYAAGVAAVLQQAAEYGVAYGWLVAVVVGAIAVYLVSRARLRYRAHG